MHERIELWAVAGQKYQTFRWFIRTSFPPRDTRKNPRSMYARVPQAMAQFVLKIEKLSHIMGSAPIVELARAYSLHHHYGSWLSSILWTVDLSRHFITAWTFQKFIKLDNFVTLQFLLFLFRQSSTVKPVWAGTFVLSGNETCIIKGNFCL